MRDDEAIYLYDILLRVRCWSRVVPAEDRHYDRLKPVIPIVHGSFGLAEMVLRTGLVQLLCFTLLRRSRIVVTLALAGRSTDFSRCVTMRLYTYVIYCYVCVADRVWYQLKTGTTTG